MAHRTVRLVPLLVAALAAGCAVEASEPPPAQQAAPAPPLAIVDTVDPGPAAGGCIPGEAYPVDGQLLQEPARCAPPYDPHDPPAPAGASGVDRPDPSRAGAPAHAARPSAAAGE